MKSIEFKIQLKAGNSRAALAFVIAYNKLFDNHRFVWSTGAEVTRSSFDPARPGAVLKRFLKAAAEAYESLKRNGEPVNNATLKARIELIRDVVAWSGDELSIWNGTDVERYAVPDGLDHDQVNAFLNQEMLKHKPDFKRVIDGILSEGKTGLFGFWQSIIDGETKPRHGKALRKSSKSVKRQSMLVVKEFNPRLDFEKMDMQFYNQFTSWMSDKKKFDSNTIGKHVRQLKSILHLAYRNELLKNDRFKYWPVIKESNEVVIPTKEELIKLTTLELSGTKEDVNDIFVLACFLGPRISDFKSMNADSLSVEKGIMFFSYVQEKTGSICKIPVHPIAQGILAKRNNQFPKMISEQNFRYNLKEICQKAEFNDRVITKVRNGKPEYKMKWEALSPHSARRMFASSLFYGWFGKPMPASLCMRYTGHKTEKSFMIYIGATEKDLDAMALEYFDLKPEIKIA